MQVKTKYKVCRRLGPGVYEKCQSEKFMLAEARRGKQRKRGRRRNVSEYNKQLLEKQKVRFSYGVQERQFRNYVRQALAQTGMTPVESLLQNLELRLDNIVSRAGIAPTRAAARQLVSHGHIMVNGKRIKVPSYTVKLKDVVSIREASHGKPVFADLAERLDKYTSPKWVLYNEGKHEITLKNLPTREDVDAVYDLTAVIEFYSR